MKPTKRGISSQWFLGCANDKERKDRTSTVEGGTSVLLVLYDILEREKSDLLKSREADYADSAWAYKQAHVNGRLEQLDRLLQLLWSAIDQ